MAKQSNQLSAMTVAKLTEPGSYLDGSGLRLQIAKGGSKSWLLRYQLDGRTREMGLGGYPAVSLADARQKAADARKLLANAVDPLAARDASREASRAEEEARKLADARRKTFKEFAEEYIAEQEAGWKNPAKLATLWRGTLARYAYPAVGHLPIAAIDTGLVMQILKPLWSTKTETAQRVRMRMEAILSAATVLGYREGPNPAIWKGCLDKLLPPARKVAKVEHHAAMPYSEIGAFMVELRQREALAARGLELLILTACRTSEVLEAQWSEFNLDGATWIIPARRMKMDREHRVPLSTPAVDILRQLHKGRTSNTWVFPGGKEGKPFSNMVFLILLERMGRRGEFTPHGFRSTFRDWAGEETAYPNHVCEMALAHSVKNGAEAAYRRGDLFEKRGKLMQAWADYCDRVQVNARKGTVVPIRG